MAVELVTVERVIGGVRGGVNSHSCSLRGGVSGCGISYS